MWSTTGLTAGAGLLAEPGRDPEGALDRGGKGPDGDQAQDPQNGRATRPSQAVGNGPIQQADQERQDQTLRALHQAFLAQDPDRLSARAGIADEKRSRDGRGGHQRAPGERPQVEDEPEEREDLDEPVQGAVDELAVR